MSEPREITWLLTAEVDFQASYNRIDRYSPDRAEARYASLNEVLGQLVRQTPDALTGHYEMEQSQTRDPRRHLGHLGSIYSCWG